MLHKCDLPVPIMFGHYLQQQQISHFYVSFCKIVMADAKAVVLHSESVPCRRLVANIWSQDGLECCQTVR